MGAGKVSTQAELVIYV